MQRMFVVCLTGLLVGCGAGQPTGGTTSTPAPILTPNTPQPTSVVLDGKLTADVLGVSFSADGTALAALDSADSVRLWDSVSGPGRDLPRAANPNTAKWVLGGRDIRFTPDGRWLCWPTTWDAVEVWDLKANARAHTLAGAATLASDVRLVFDADGRLVTKAVNGFVVEAIRWDLTTGKRAGRGEVPGDSTPHADGLTCSSNSKTKDNEIAVHRLDGSQLTSIPWQGGATSTRVTDPAGRVFVASDGSTVQVHDLPSGRRRFSLPAPNDLDHAMNVRYALALSVDGRRIALPRGKEVVVFDARTGDRLEVISQAVKSPEAFGLPPNVTAIAFSPDGKRLATGWSDGMVRVHPLSASAADTQDAKPIFAIIYYHNPIKVPDEAFKRAADTLKAEHADGYTLMMLGVTTEEDFVAAWKKVADTASDQKLQVAEVHLLTHADFGINQKGGLEFVPDKGDGTLTGEDVAKLPKLPWVNADTALIRLYGCNTGVDFLLGWAPVKEFAKTQGVKATGEGGWSYFSSDPSKYVALTSDDKRVYLRAYKRKRNVVHEGVNVLLEHGSVIPGIDAKP